MDPLISIILPAFNSINYLAQAIESVIAQTYTNWELIVINDGSTDGTTEYLEGISHTAIQVVHQQNQGVSTARNTGLLKASGVFITFLDADDFLPPRSLEIRSSYLQNNPCVGIVDGGISVRDESLNREHRLYKPYYQGPLLPRLLRLDARVFFGPFYMFRKDKLCETGFAEQMTHAEDLLFFMTLASRSKLIYGYVSEVVYCYRSTKTSTMSNMEGLEKGYLQLLENVGFLNGVSFFDKIYLKLKVTRILFLCWFSKGNVCKAISAAAICIFA